MTPVASAAAAAAAMSDNIKHHSKLGLVIITMGK